MTQAKKAIDTTVLAIIRILMGFGFTKAMVMEFTSCSNAEYTRYSNAIKAEDGFESVKGVQWNFALRYFATLMVKGWMKSDNDYQSRLYNILAHYLKADQIFLSALAISHTIHSLSADDTALLSEPYQRLYRALYGHTWCEFEWKSKADGRDVVETFFRDNLENVESYRNANELLDGIREDLTKSYARNIKPRDIPFFQEQKSLLQVIMEQEVNSLKEVYKDILTLRFGLDGSPSISCDEIAQRLNVGNRERVRQLESKVLRILRHPARTITKFVKRYYHTSIENLGKNSTFDLLKECGIDPVDLQRTEPIIYFKTLEEFEASEIDYWDLSVRTYNVLKRAEIRTGKDLLMRTEAELRQVANMGNKSILELQGILEANNLAFKTD